jgi:three-Cys-motif partner protein
VSVPADELREWGDWTELKLGILGQYLDEFTTASKRVDSRVFLDAFAGQGRGRSRTTGDVFEGSARIALNVIDPEFTHLRYFERDPTNARLLRQALETEYPGRDIKVFEGDCNDRIPEALAELRSVSWAPTFAFLDPDGIQLRWSTLQVLAAHKKRSPYKTELWLLFSTMGLVRRLALDESKLRRQDEQAANDAFGDESWRPVYDQRRRDDITGQQARAEYINLYRWKLETELGYAHTFALEIRNDRGVPIYAMVFATDNEAGKRIMLHLYEKAARDAPRRRELVKAQRDGALQMQLGFADEVALRDPLWTDAPWQPPA